MKIKIANGVMLPQSISEVVDLNHFDMSANYSLKGIKPFTLHVQFETFEEEIEVHLNALIPVTLECAYSLDHFGDEIQFEETLVFNFKNPEIELISDDIFYEKGPLIDLDPYVFALLLTYIPLKVIKPGAKLPSSGEDYAVYSEEEYLTQKGKETPFDDLLSSLDIDEE